MVNRLPSEHHEGMSSDMGRKVSLYPAYMPRIATVDERYQSFNLEMLEVTGGRFWKPYEAANSLPGDVASPPGDDATPAGMDPAVYQYRPPKDLTNRRLRLLAAALAPSYLRVSGTWANTVYLPADGEQVTRPPDGFTVVLTRDQWQHVLEFARAIGAPLVTSFAISSGVRDASGVWTTDQAARILDLTDELGGTLAAAEFMNEPTAALMGGAPEGYDAAAYGRDFRLFRSFMRDRAPEVTILGPGSVGETVAGESALGYGTEGVLSTQEMLRDGGADVDAFSYHHYGAASQRCAGVGMPRTTLAEALGEAWLSSTDQTLAFYRPLRDEFTPGKPFWLTETAQAACGGDPWSSTFIDSFRYLDQLGRLAKSGVSVVIHNTLAASDYALLDERTYEPRPSYWAALLWSRTMGTTVLEAGVPIGQGLHVYAHSQRQHPGGVSVLVINTSPTDEQFLIVPAAGERFTLSADEIEGRTVRLNGTPLRLGKDDELPELHPVPSEAGSVSFAPATLTIITLPDADNTDTRFA